VSACRTGFACGHELALFQHYTQAVSRVVAVVEGRKPEHGKGLGWWHLRGRCVLRHLRRFVPYAKLILSFDRLLELGILVWQDFMFACGQVSYSFST
jgi:hypothetical protein